MSRIKQKKKQHAKSKIVNVVYLQQKERLKSGKKTLSDTELIHDEIDKEVSFCTCRNPLRVEMVDEGKYRVSENFLLPLLI